MKFDENDITILSTLANIDEARAYIKFLLSESRRHRQDRIDIHKRIKEVCEMYPECKFLEGIK